METGASGYHVVYLEKAPGPITSLIAVWVQADQPLRAVLWSVPKRQWIYAPAIAASLLYGDLEMGGTDPVDRATAERVARESLGTEVPSEEELHRICEDGASQPHH